MQTGKFIVGSIHKSDNSVSFSKNPSEHGSEPSARKEAARLAMKFPERKFVVAEIKGIVTYDTVRWE